jgi:hypothetical protein
LRLWSIHPKYLDTKGIVALWREGLLARKVLLGRTKGYKNHPQLIRFKQTTDPVGYIDEYLNEVYKEACRRGYNFDRKKINPSGKIPHIKVNTGQIKYEFNHLKKKLKIRDNKVYEALLMVNKPVLNHVFIRRAGSIEPWEKKPGRLS